MSQRHPKDGLPYYGRLFREAVSESVRDDFAAHRELMIAGFWMISRSKRHPEIPARTYWTNAEPGNPDNVLDRWPLPFIAGEIGGDLADPLDIFGAPRKRQIKEAEYQYQMASMAWAREYSPEEPLANPDRRVDLSKIPVPFAE
jgi:hypothetical protein